MAVGDIERLVEGLVNRGLVAPSMVGRTVGQATIEELKNLGSNLSESQATRQNLNEQRLSDLKSRAIQGGAFKTSRGAGTGVNNYNQLIKDINAPVLLGKSGQNSLLAIRSNEGYKLGTTPIGKSGLRGIGSSTNSLYDIAKRNTLNPNTPILGASSELQVGKTFNSLQALMNALATGLTGQAESDLGTQSPISPADLKRYYNL